MKLFNKKSSNKEKDANKQSVEAYFATLGWTSLRALLDDDVYDLVRVY